MLNKVRTLYISAKNILRCFTTVLFCFWVYLITAQQTKESNKKPNFIIILTDDQGYADLSCFGGNHVATPNIDKMATEGAKLTSFYVASPLCSPSRAALMTGSYPKRINMAVGSNFPVLLAADSKGLNPNEITIAEVLKNVGYKTGMFGKWHLGDQPDFLPTKQGFDEFFGLPYSHDIHPFHKNQAKFNFPPLPLLDNERVIETNPDSDLLNKRITERTVKFINENKEAPFFIYLPHTSPHRPLLASPKFMANASVEVQKVLKNEHNTIDYKTRDKIYRQTISEIDWSVGQVLEVLKKNGLDENTFVIFTSDNGPVIGNATPFRGKKGQTLEGGMRMPTVIRWPGKIEQGQVIDELLTTMDLYPTLAKLAGAEIPKDRIIDGKDIFSVLQGESKTPHEMFFYYKKETLEAVRSGKWKMRIASKQAPQLYNLENDAEERINIAKNHPKIVERLLMYIQKFELDLEKNTRPAAFIKNPKPLTK